MPVLLGLVIGIIFNLQLEFIQTERLVSEVTHYFFPHHFSVMVLTNDEYQKAKSDPKLSSLFKLRNATTSYIIQCLADREIQNAVNDQQQRSKTYRYNCEVIHSPVKYVDVEAADGVGWNSTSGKPRKVRYLRPDTRGGQQSNEILKLKTQITRRDKIIANLKQEQNKIIANLKQEQNVIKENLQILVRDLQADNFCQSQKIQQLIALVSDKEKTIAGLKADALVSKTKIQRLETLVAAKEKTIIALKVSNESWQNELYNARKLVDSLKKEKKELALSAKKREDRAKIDRIRQVDQYFDRYVFNNNPAKPSYKDVSLKAETSKDASSTINFRKLFVFAGICYVAYKNPGSLVNLLRHISFYSLLSLRKMFTSSIFLIDLPLNMLTTKQMY